jgi:hypothetical protein
MLLLLVLWDVLDTLLGDDSLRSAWRRPSQRTDGPHNELGSDGACRKLSVWCRISIDTVHNLSVARAHITRMRVGGLHGVVACFPLNPTVCQDMDESPILSINLPFKPMQERRHHWHNGVLSSW